VRWIAVCTTLCLVLTACGKEPKAIRWFSPAELEYLGQQIFEQEEAKQRSSPLIAATEAAKTIGKDQIRGWVVSRNRVRWLRDGKDGIEVAYDAFFTADAPPQLFAPIDRKLAPEEVSKWAAETLAAQNIEKPCSKNYDFAAIRDKDGGWLVWALAVDSDPRKSFIGGHYRFTISADGTKILQRDALSMDCLTMTRPDDVKDRNKNMMQFVTQLVPGIPVETNVWQNLRNKIPLVVATPDRVEWGIRNGQMRKVGTVPKDAPLKPQCKRPDVSIEPFSFRCVMPRRLSWSACLRRA
jgi:hypothetical protein